MGLTMALVTGFAWEKIENTEALVNHFRNYSGKLNSVHRTQKIKIFKFCLDLKAHQDCTMVTALSMCLETSCHAPSATNLPGISFACTAQTLENKVVCCLFISSLIALAMFGSKHSI